MLFGSASSALADARVTQALPSASSADAPSSPYRGALALATLSPGIAPWIGARVGLGSQNEAGLIYSGRSLRIDARHAFVDGAWALSFGLGGTAVLAQPRASDNDLPAVRIQGTSGWGFDVPVLVGWQSPAGLVRWWTGPRGGYEHLGGRVGLQDVESIAWSGSHRWAGAQAGLAMGLRHVFLALELDAFYHWVHVSISDQNFTIHGFTLAPGSALVAKF